MAETIKYDRPSFLHWEADRTQSRGRIKLSADAKTGDLLILGDSGYASYDGSTANVKASPTDADIVVAVALEDGKNGDEIVCVVRNATLIADKINNVDVRSSDGELDKLYAHFANQMLVLRASIAIERGIK